MIKVTNIFKLLTLFLACLTLQLRAQNEITTLLGEQLTYRIEFLNLSAGSIDFNIAEINNIDSSAAYHLIVNARTNKIFSPLFGVQNIYESFFNTSTFLPLLLKKDIKQKNINHRLTINFNQGKNIASISDSIFWNIPDSCYSFFSMFYFLRNREFLHNDTVKFYLDSENLPSKGAAFLSGRETISIPSGRFEAIKVKLSFEPLSSRPRPWKTDLITNRMANPNSKITIWFSDDEYRLPLIIQFKQKNFKVKLVLKQFEHPLTIESVN